MTRDLGPQQLRLVRFAGRYFGMRVDYVHEMFEVSPRRARKVIRSLVDRGLVIVIDDPWTGNRRVFTPEAHGTWVREQRLADQRRQQSKLWPGLRTASTPDAAR